MNMHQRKPEALKIKTDNSIFIRNLHKHKIITIFERQAIIILLLFGLDN